MRIGICGAGVGGLSAAIGLLSLGYEVDIFEKAPGVKYWYSGDLEIYGGISKNTICKNISL